MRRFALIFTLVLLFHSRAALAQCHKIASWDALSDTAINWLEERTPEKGRVVILPFRDNAANRPDPNLAAAVPYAVELLFGDQTQILPQEVVNRALRIHAKELKELDTPQTAAQVASYTQAAVVIFGSLQRTDDGRVRAIVNLYSAKQNITLSPAESFWTITDDGFFTPFADAIQKGWQRLKLGSLKRSNAKLPSFHAFRYYAKGRELSDRYNLTNLTLANVWFDKALRADFQKFDLAAIHLAKTCFMQGLMAKNARQPYTAEWTAGKEAAEWVSQSAPASKTAVFQRFLSAQSAFTAGLIAYQNKQSDAALRHAQTSLTWVPEDGQAQNLYLLARANAKIVGTTTARNPVCF